MIPGIVATRMLRVRRNAEGSEEIVECWVRDLPASDATWTANTRVVASEANEECLFPGRIDARLIATLCRCHVAAAPAGFVPADNKGL